MELVRGGAGRVVGSVVGAKERLVGGTNNAMFIGGGGGGTQQLPSMQRPRVAGVTRDRTDAYRKARTGILRTVDLATPVVGGKPQLRGGDIEMQSLTGHNYEAGEGEGTLGAEPAWMSLVHETRSAFGKIETKIKELRELHKQHLLPDFDDRTEEVHAIEILTAEITKIFQMAQKCITRLGKLGGVTAQEASLKQHITTDLAGSLQQLSSDFRRAQKTYLSKLQSRLDRTNRFQGVARPKPKRTRGQRTTYDIEEGEGDTSGNDSDAAYDFGFSSRQLQELEEAEGEASARANEIKAIHKSIIDLAEVFKEMALLVTDQGTILDRIDYNIETTARNMDGALVELRKAQDYQKKTGQKLCMLLLVGLILGTIFVIIIRFLLFR